MSEPAAISSIEPDESEPIEPEVDRPDLFGEGPEPTPYVEDAGPGIPEEEGGAEQALPALEIGSELARRPSWKQDAIADILDSTGKGLHQLFGAAENDWVMTQEDLERIVPPLTRIVNRYDPIARAAPYADPILVTKGVAIYTWRSVLERQRALRDRPVAEGYVREPPSTAGANGAQPAAGRGMRSPVAGEDAQAEELPGSPADYHEPGMFDQ